MEPPGDITILLTRIKSGDEDALVELIPLVYTELRCLAGHFMREERAGHTLQPTALVREAYLCLAGQDRANWQNRAVAPQPSKPGPRAGAERWDEILAVRYFGGLPVEEAAEALSVSPRTVKRDWAKGWLHTKLSGVGLE